MPDGSSACGKRYGGARFCLLRPYGMQLEGHCGPSHYCGIAKISRSVILRCERSEPRRMMAQSTARSPFAIIMTDAMLPRERCDFSAIVDRKPLKLPLGARVVVWTI